jgi:hypothetical protein
MVSNLIVVILIGYLFLPFRFIIFTAGLFQSSSGVVYPRWDHRFTPSVRGRYVLVPSALFAALREIVFPVYP